MNTEEQVINSPAPRVGRVLRKAFADVYDYLGLVVAGSFIWLVGSLIPVTLGIELHKRTGSPVPMLIGIAASLIFAVLLGFGLFYMAHKIVYRDDPSLYDILIGFKRLFLPVILLALVDIIVTGILYVDIRILFGGFAMSQDLAKNNPVFFVAGIVSVWVMAFWLMTALYHGPVLMASYYLPELEVRKPTTFSVLRRGVLLALGAPFFTMVFLFAIIAVTILSFVSRFGMAIFVVFPGIVAIVLTHAARALFIKYGVLEERPEVVEDKRWKLEP